MKGWMETEQPPIVGLRSLIDAKGGGEGATALLPSREGTTLGIHGAPGVHSLSSGEKAPMQRKVKVEPRHEHAAPMDRRADEYIGLAVKSRRKGEFESIVDHKASVESLTSSFSQLYSSAAVTATPGTEAPRDTLVWNSSVSTAASPAAAPTRIAKRNEGMVIFQVKPPSSTSSSAARADSVVKPSVSHASPLPRPQKPVLPTRPEGAAEAEVPKHLPPPPPPPPPTLEADVKTKPTTLLPGSSHLFGAASWTIESKASTSVPKNAMTHGGSTSSASKVPLDEPPQPDPEPEPEMEDLTPKASTSSTRVTTTSERAEDGRKVAPTGGRVWVRPKHKSSTVSTEPLPASSSSMDKMPRSIVSSTTANVDEKAKSGADGGYGLFGALLRGDTEPMRLECLADFKCLNPGREFNGGGGSYLTELTYKLEVISALRRSRPDIVIKSEVETITPASKRARVDLLVHIPGVGQILFELKYIPLAFWIRPPELDVHSHHRSSEGVEHPPANARIKRLAAEVEYLQKLDHRELLEQWIRPFVEEPDKKIKIMNYLEFVEVKQTKDNHAGLIFTHAHTGHVNPRLPFPGITTLLIGGNTAWRVFFPKP